MLKKYQLSNGKLTESTTDLGQIWVYTAPDEQERKYLVSDLKIDEHTLASALDPDELSRLEFEPEHMALIFKRPKNYSSADNFRFRVSSCGIFLFNDRLVVVQPEDTTFLDGKYSLKLQSLYDVMLKVIYRSIFHFLEHMKVINMISDDLEKKVETSMENRHLLSLFALEKSLVYYVNAIHANGGLIDKFRSNASKIGFNPEQMEFIDDITIENNQCAKLAEIYSNILASLMDARASIVSNNLNVLMKNLNAVVIAVAVPSFFAGMGGMSEFSAVTNVKK